MRMLKRWGFRAVPTCACHDMTLRMNMNGAQWVRDNADIIVEAMRVAANDPLANPLRLPFIAPLARRLVLHCARMPARSR